MVGILEKKIYKIYLPLFPSLFLMSFWCSLVIFKLLSKFPYLEKILEDAFQIGILAALQLFVDHEQTHRARNLVVIIRVIAEKFFFFGNSIKILRSVGQLQESVDEIGIFVTVVALVADCPVEFPSGILEKKDDKISRKRK